MTTHLDKAVEAVPTEAREAFYDVLEEAGLDEALLAAFQAADDLLREHYWGELRERLLGEARGIEDLGQEAYAAGGHATANQRWAEAGAIREAVEAHAALSTTQHKGAPQ